MSRATSHESATTIDGADIVLTSVAERYALDKGIIGAARNAPLDDRCAVGDLVHIEAAGGGHDFIVLRRRWISRNGTTRLEVTLDHPARRGS